MAIDYKSTYTVPEAVRHDFSPKGLKKHFSSWSKQPKDIEKALEDKHLYTYAYALSRGVPRQLRHNLLTSRLIELITPIQKEGAGPFPVNDTIRSNIRLLISPSQNERLIVTQKLRKKLFGSKQWGQQTFTAIIHGLETQEDYQNFLLFAIRDTKRCDMLFNYATAILAGTLPAEWILSSQQLQYLQQALVDVLVSNDKKPRSHIGKKRRKKINYDNQVISTILTTASNDQETFERLNFLVRDKNRRTALIQSQLLQQALEDKPSSLAAIAVKSTLFPPADRVISKLTSDNRWTELYTKNYSVSDLAKIGKRLETKLTQLNQASNKLHTKFYQWVKNWWAVKFKVSIRGKKRTLPIHKRVVRAILQPHTLMLSPEDHRTLCALELAIEPSVLTSHYLNDKTKQAIQAKVPNNASMTSVEPIVKVNTVKIETSLKLTDEEAPSRQSLSKEEALLVESEIESHYPDDGPCKSSTTEVLQALFENKDSSLLVSATTENSVDHDVVMNNTLNNSTGSDESLVVTVDYPDEGLKEVQENKIEINEVEINDVSLASVSKPDCVMIQDSVENAIASDKTLDQTNDIGLAFSTDSTFAPIPTELEEQQDELAISDVEVSLNEASTENETNLILIPPSSPISQMSLVLNATDACSSVDFKHQIGSHEANDSQDAVEEEIDLSETSVNGLSFLGNESFFQRNNHDLGVARSSTELGVKGVQWGDCTDVMQSTPPSSPYTAQHSSTQALEQLVLSFSPIVAPMDPNSTKPMRTRSLQESSPLKLIDLSIDTPERDLEPLVLSFEQTPDKGSLALLDLSLEQSSPEQMQRLELSATDDETSLKPLELSHDTSAQQVSTEEISLDLLNLSQASDMVAKLWCSGNSVFNSPSRSPMGILDLSGAAETTPKLNKHSPQ